MIASDEMIPLELLILKPVMLGNSLSPRAFYAQWLELNEKASWLLFQATAIEKKDFLVGYISVWDLMSD